MNSTQFVNKKIKKVLMEIKACNSNGLTGWGIFTCYDDTDSITWGIGDNPSLSEDVILVLTGW